jgi:glutathione S-transferase
MPAKLYVVPASHPCATVVRALELKKVPFERVDLVPALHKAVQRARFGRGTVPGIEFEDGRKVLGSRPILATLERDVPAPPLYPPEGTDARRRADEAEEWGDQVLQPLVRRILWHALSVDRSAQLSYLDGARLVPPTPRPLARLSGGLVAALERRFNASTVPAVRADLIHLPRHLDRVDRWIGQGVLRDDGVPGAADLQVASGVRLLMTLDDLAPMIDRRPAGAHARRWFPSYPGRTPAGALNAAWLPAGA